MIISWDRFIELISGNSFVIRGESNGINIRRYNSLYQHFRDEKLYQLEVHMNATKFDINKDDNEKVLIKDGVIHIVMRNYMSKIPTQLVIVKDVEFMDTEEIKTLLVKSGKKLNKELVEALLLNVPFKIGMDIFNHKKDELSTVKRDGEVVAYFFKWLEDLNIGMEEHEGVVNIEDMKDAVVLNNVLYLKGIDGEFIECQFEDLEGVMEEWEAKYLANNQDKRNGCMDSAKILANEDTTGWGGCGDRT